MARKFPHPTGEIIKRGFLPPNGPSLGCVLIKPEKAASAKGREAEKLVGREWRRLRDLWMDGGEFRTKLMGWEEGGGHRPTYGPKERGRRKVGWQLNVIILGFFRIFFDPF